MAEDKVVTTKVSIDLLEQLDDVATRIDRTRSWVVREALAQWLGEEETRHRLTLDALASVNEGRLVDQADVEARMAERRKKRSQARNAA